MKSAILAFVALSVLGACARPPCDQWCKYSRALAPIVERG